MPLTPWADGDTAPTAKTKLNAIITALEAHTADDANPHGVTAAQAGAVPVVDPATAGNLPVLTAAGELEDGEVALDDVALRDGDAVAGNLAAMTAAGDAADSGIDPADLARLDGATFTGEVGITRGFWILTRDTGYGPPTSGTYDTGAHWWDLAGAHYYCTAGGTPGTWVQLTPGALSSAPAAGSFNGGAILAGYRYYDTTDNLAWVSWQDSGSHYRWQSAELYEQVMGVSREERTSAGSGQSPFRSFWPSAFDIRLVKFSVGVEGSGTFDVSNYWTVSLQKWIPSSLTDIDSTDQDATTYRVWDAVPSGTDGHIAVGSFRVANLMVTVGAGTPGTLYLEYPKYSYRWVKS